MDIEHSAQGSAADAKPWNKGKLTGAKPASPVHEMGPATAFSNSCRNRRAAGGIANCHFGEGRRSSPPWRGTFGAIVARLRLGAVARGIPKEPVAGNGR
jgi:hypothetical protein